MFYTIRKFAAVVSVLSMVAFAACGDDSDESRPDKMSTNNVNNSNNANNANNSNNSATNNTNNTNNTSPNNSNNLNNTNNGTNQSGDLTCTEILQCILGCQTDDMSCPDMCRAQGTPAAQGEIEAYLGCVDENCPMDLGITELNECIATNCSQEQDTCLEL